MEFKLDFIDGIPIEEFNASSRRKAHLKDRFYQNFVNAGKAKVRSPTDRSDDDLHERGVIALKRTLLGFCGNCTTVSIDELANALHTVSAVNSLEDGKKMALELDNASFDYGVGNALQIYRCENGIISVNKWSADYSSQTETQYPFN